jgi:hypothetical protein
MLHGAYVNRSEEVAVFKDQLWQQKLPLLMCGKTGIPLCEVARWMPGGARVSEVSDTAESR